ncbi:MAG: serine hydrolase [Deferribacteres bacterium]|nr:serine hydrolase [candidate division KSB1 bacterium]MCB9511292.1 serine hydrolase [Deferribacteres bacterium]
MEKSSFAVFFFSFCFFLTSTALAQSRMSTSLPYSIPDQQIQPLVKLVDARFQKALEKRLRQNPRWSELITRKKMAVGLVDISNPAKVKYARVNGPVMMYAASLPKLAILLAANQALEDGVLIATPEINHDMRIMISKSNNAAATRMIDRIGMERIQAVLKDPRYQLYDRERGGGLWIGRRYSKQSKRIPEPILGLSHAATVTQVCRFYYLLAMGKLVSRERCSEMLESLRDPEINHKFVNSLHEIVPDATLYRKSGTWQNWHSDSVLVWGPNWRRYIVVGLIEAPDGEQILRDLIPAVEEVLKLNQLTISKK